jgi:hypothetical protein
LAATRLGLYRVEFLFRAMQVGAQFLDDSNTDFRREAAFGGENHAIEELAKLSASERSF